MASCAAIGAAPAAAPAAPEGIATAAGFRVAREFLPVFAPTLHRDAYTAWVSPAPVDEVLRHLERVPQLLHPPGSWQATPTLPLDAFGDTGIYDRSRLARLYAPTRVMVARGPVAPAGSPGEMWTLFSPYPNPGLDHLERGTLLMTLT